MGDWKTLSSAYVHENTFYKVRKDNVIRPDGKPGTYHVIETRGAVIVIVITKDDKLLLEYTFRYPTQTWGWEVPAGGIDEGEEPLEAAKRELQEETGYQATTWEYIGKSEPANSILKSDHHIYICRGLSAQGPHAQEEEGITDLKAFSMDEVMHMIADGKIVDEVTLGPLLLALSKGKLPPYSANLLQK